MFLPKPCKRLSSPHTRYMPRPSHSSRFYHLHNIWWGVQIIKLLIMKFSPFPCHLVPLRPKYFLNTLFSNTLSLRSSLNVSDRVSHPHKTTGKLPKIYACHLSQTGHRTALRCKLQRIPDGVVCGVPKHVGYLTAYEEYVVWVKSVLWTNASCLRFSALTL
jgi:hypothetical protein